MDTLQIQQNAVNRDIKHCVQRIDKAVHGLRIYSVRKYPAIHKSVNPGMMGIQIPEPVRMNLKGTVGKVNHSKDENRKKQHIFRQTGTQRSRKIPDMSLDPDFHASHQIRSRPENIRHRPDKAFARPKEQNHKEDSIKKSRRYPPVKNMEKSRDQNHRTYDHGLNRDTEAKTVS